MSPDSRVFISYSARDARRVSAIWRILQSDGIPFWLDQRSIPGGMSWGPEIVRALRECAVVMVMCSDSAMRSRNVRQEIQLAWRFGKPMLPVLLESISYPDQLLYFLEGWQQIAILDHPPEQWRPALYKALSAAGIPVPQQSDSNAASIEPAIPPRDLSGLLTVARLNDRIWPVPAARVPPWGMRAPVRAVGSPQDGAERHFHIGDRLSVAIESEQDGFLTLLDFGPTGRVYCLCPSLFAPDGTLSRGRVYLPTRQGRHDHFQASGPAGREQLLAVITDRPLDLPWMPEDPAHPARVLDGGDIADLLDRIDGLEGSQWIALSTYFEVIE